MFPTDVPCTHIMHYKYKKPDKYSAINEANTPCLHTPAKVTHCSEYHQAKNSKLWRTSAKATHWWISPDLGDVLMSNPLCIHWFWKWRCSGGCRMQKESSRTIFLGLVCMPLSQEFNHKKVDSYMLKPLTWPSLPLARCAQSTNSLRLPISTYF
jgi:hypothetical protein